MYSTSVVHPNSSLVQNTKAACIRDANGNAEDARQKWQATVLFQQAARDRNATI